MAAQKTGSKLKQCDCKSDSAGNTQGAKYQDKRYGKQIRVHSIKKDGKGYKCTVCGKAVIA